MRCACRLASLREASASPKQEKEKDAGIVGVNMETGQADHQILFKDKEPDYKVDEASGYVFNLKNSRELIAYAIK